MVCREACTGSTSSSLSFWSLSLIGWGFRSWPFTLNKLERLKQAFAVNTLAWDNGIGLAPISLVFSVSGND